MTTCIDDDDFMMAYVGLECLDSRSSAKKKVAHEYIPVMSGIL